MLFDKEFRKDLKEGAVSLMLCNLGDYISGYFLQIFQPIIMHAEILLALLPAASDARGDVYSSYGSRLGTLLHLGLAKKLIKAELMALSSILILINTWIGLLTFVVSVVFGKYHLEPYTTVFVAVLSAVISSILMIPSTTWLAFTSFKRGINPDNVVAPIATLFGDMVTVPTIVFAYLIATGVPRIVMILFTLFLLVIPAYVFYRIATRGENDPLERTLNILIQNIPIIMFSTSMSMLAGVILMTNINNIVKGIGILAVIPAFLEDGGAIACRFSSRLSTNLHLGSIKIKWLPTDSWTLKQVLLNMIHALIIFGSLSIFGFAVAVSRGASIAWGLKVMEIVMSAGMMLTVIITVLTYYAAMISFKAGIDPDNTLAPILTSLADIIGTSSLAFMLIVMG